MARGPNRAPVISVNRYPFRLPKEGLELTRPVAHSRIERRANDGDVKEMRRVRKTLDMLQVRKAADSRERPL